MAQAPRLGSEKLWRRVRPAQQYLGMVAGAAARPTKKIKTVGRPSLAAYGNIMRQYLLDEISKSDIPRVREYLHEHAQASRLEDIWWVDLPEDLLSPEQFSHRDCRPFRFAVEVGDNFVRFEFLIRSQQTMRCACIGYATRVQRDFILAFADRLVEDLALRT